jgi:hypothetical protein
MIGFFRLRESSGTAKEALPETARLEAPKQA